MAEDGAPAVGSLKTAEFLQELCASCEQHVKDAVGLALDGSIETLPVLDHYLRISAQSVRERPELVPLLSRTAGAYFGQVVAAHFGGFWWAQGADAHRWYVCFRNVYLALNPVGIAHRALVWKLDSAPEGPPAELHLAREDRGWVSERLEALPPVREGDFYSLSVCVESLEIASAALGEQMAAAGTADVLFDEDDYVAELGDPSLA